MHILTISLEEPIPEISIHQAVQNADRGWGHSILYANSGEIKSYNNGGRIVFNYAAKKGGFDIVSYLARTDAHMNANDDEATPLRFTVQAESAIETKRFM